ncbi:unnamed protein product, partial [Coregonus sp. 'balchen']
FNSNPLGPEAPPSQKKRKTEITDGIVDFIALDMRPVNLTEGVGFKMMMKILVPGYTVPKRETILHALTAKYDYTKEKDLESIKNSCAVTQFYNRHVDLTENGVLHDQAWKLQCLVLETK